MTSEVPAETGRSYRKGAARRAEILSKAIGLFASHGVEASLRAIGDAIGVSHAALRYYFPSRDELLVEVYRTHEGARHGTVIAEGSSAVELMELSAENNRAIPYGNQDAVLLTMLPADVAGRADPSRRNA